MIVFGGSYGQAYMKDDGPQVSVSVGMWATDDEGKEIFNDNLVQYPGYENVGTTNEKAGKAIQAENARGLSPCDNVIIFAYSAGTEASLMYAKWRVEQNTKQPVRAVVLLGPTFGSYNESGKPPLLNFGQTEINNENKDPLLKYDDWADYITVLLRNRVDVYVYADNGTSGNEVHSANAYAEYYKSISGINGVFEINHQPTKEHTVFTKSDTSLKEDIYNWIEIH